MTSGILVSAPTTSDSSWLSAPSMAQVAAVALVFHRKNSKTARWLGVQRMLDTGKGGVVGGNPGKFGHFSI